jgi:hypothetical protein
MVLKLCPVIPANAGIHNHRYLLNGFDRDRFIASAAIGFLSALPASGLFGRQASLGRPKACVCLPSFVLPSWTERPLLIATESLAAPTAVLPQAANRNVRPTLKTLFLVVRPPTALSETCRHALAHISLCREVCRISMMLGFSDVAQRQLW